MSKEVIVESFELDHTIVKAPYVRLIGKETGPKGDVISNFDIRLVQPNEDCQMQQQAQASIQQILGLMPQFTLPSGQPPKFELNPFKGTNIYLPDLGSAAFGTISPITQSAFSLGAIPQVQRLQVQAFSVDRKSVV